MAYDPNNIFAKILRGEASCIKLYEDEHTMSFMDIMPQSDGHLLVLPKEPAEHLLDLSPESASACIHTVQKMAQAVKTALDVPGIAVAQLNGETAGQTVPHCHFHIIPRVPGVQHRKHATTPEDPEKLQAIAQRIIAALG